MHHAPGHVTAPGDGVLQGGDGEPGLHPRVDRVPHDPVGEHVLDRAEVELALDGGVLGGVGQITRRATVTTSRLNSGGNFFGMTSILPRGQAPHIRCQATRGIPGR